ncbi:MAG TPA: hypothetical protein VF040_16875 [Ktedonobacterales bacterium]
MAKVKFSKDGDEHFTASLRECLEDIQQRGNYLLYDGDLLWNPATILRVRTQEWLGQQGTVTWWPAGKQLDIPEREVRAVAVGRAELGERFVLVDAEAIPSSWQL